ncbi:hypothetical protein AB0912_12885 [Streptomyces sp. NPDC007084]|uniref:hypothetical protein n=1 Tax=Streptomyces sp. NPDC007084 TaxID=3154313 RepID=UPI003453E931
MLTFKDAAVDEESGSKPEHETEVAEADAVHAVLRGLGHVETKETYTGAVGARRG